MRIQNEYGTTSNAHIANGHQMPFTMLVDFEAVAKALKDIDYSGYLTLEAPTYLSSYREKTVLDGLKKLAESVRRIDQMIKNF